MSQKQLLRDALVGFVVGLVVMAGVALVTRPPPSPPVQTR
jgi:hypothetical protein